jgi:peroxiredoxin
VISLGQLLTFCRAVLGITFVVSLGAKVGNVSQFVEAISSFQLLPKSWAKYAAVLFLSGEAAIVAFMGLGDRLLPIGLGLSTLLLAVFTLAILSALARNIRVSCSCFGHTRKPVSIFDVARTAVLAGCGLVGWWAYQRMRGGLGSENWLEQTWTLLGAIGQGSPMTALLAANAVITWLVLLFIIPFVLLLAKRINQLTQQSPKEQILREVLARRGQQAPPFTAQDLSGDTVTLDSFKGTPVAFVFLSPSCQACIERIPALNNFAAHTNGMQIVIVNVDPHVPSATFVAEHAVRYPVLSAPQVLNRFAKDYGANSTPSFCLVDADQRIQAAGHLDSQYWQDQLALMWA